MEVINDLVGYKNLKIYQNTDWFLFSLDSVLLANFVTLTKRSKKILDMCTGNAPIPLILTTKTKSNIVGVEIQKDIYDLAVKSVNYNHLNEQISLINEDIINYSNNGLNLFDTITVNPPYFKITNLALINYDIHKSIARHEIKLKIEDVLAVAEKLLNDKGNIALIYRTERFMELLLLFNKYHFEPKRIQFVYSKINYASELFLIEATKNGHSGLKILKPLIIYNSDNSYTSEVLKMLGR